MGVCPSGSHTALSVARGVRVADKSERQDQRIEGERRRLPLQNLGLPIRPHRLRRRRQEHAVWNKRGSIDWSRFQRPGFRQAYASASSATSTCGPVASPDVVTARSDECARRPRGPPQDSSLGRLRRWTICRLISRFGLAAFHRRIGLAGLALAADTDRGATANSNAASVAKDRFMVTSRRDGNSARQ